MRRLASVLTEQRRQPVRARFDVRIEKDYDVTGRCFRSEQPSTNQTLAFRCAHNLHFALVILSLQLVLQLVLEECCKRKTMKTSPRCAYTCTVTYIEEEDRRTFGAEVVRENDFVEQFGWRAVDETVYGAQKSGPVLIVERNDDAGFW